ncbi:hypothetical protein [Marinovum sp.]|uniref:hypothetical protein n=1 Tax=Marinovum sp. TaxID=2024839 RepID=UPI003A8F4D71
MPTPISNNDLLCNTQTQGRRFARVWEQAGPDLTGALTLQGRAALARLREGDCLRAEDAEGLRLIGHIIIDTHDRLAAQLENAAHGEGSLKSKKCLIEVLMLSFLAFIERRQEALDRGGNSTERCPQG